MSEAVRLGEKWVTKWCKGLIEVVGNFRNNIIARDWHGGLGSLGPGVEMGGQHTPGKNRAIVIYIKETVISVCSIPRREEI